MAEEPDAEPQVWVQAVARVLRAAEVEELHAAVAPVAVQERAVQASAAVPALCAVSALAQVHAAAQERVESPDGAQSFAAESQGEVALPVAFPSGAEDASQVSSRVAAEFPVLPSPVVPWSEALPGALESYVSRFAVPWAA